MKILIKIIILFLLLVFTETAFGACTVSTTSVNFSSYDVFLTSPTDSTGSIIIVCDTFFTFVMVAIGQSPNSGGFDPRQMASGAEYLDYNLYTTATYTSIWGDGTGGTVTRNTFAFRNRPRTLTVYGRIPPGQDIPAGSYAETLTVTITW